MTRYAKAGQTLLLKGTLSAYGTIIAEAGTATKAGAVVEVAAGYTEHNLGVIALQGGSAKGATGATLLAIGTLTNAGTITIGGGYATGQGALLNVTGTLLDSGVLTVGAGYNGGGGQLSIAEHGTLTVGKYLGLLTLQASSYRQPGSGATLVDAGVLDNQATIDVLGATFFRDQNYTSGNLTVTATGALTNQGTLVASGTLSIAGVLNNSGSIQLNMGTWLDTGSIINTGTIATFAPAELSGALTNSGFLHSYNGLNETSSIVNGGTLIDGGNSSLQQVENTGLFEIQNHGSVTIQSGGVFTNDHTLILAAGTYDDFTGVPGFSGHLTIASGGSLINNATVTIDGLYNLNGFSYVGVLDVVGVLTNFGTIDVQGGAGSYGGVMIVSGKVVNDGSIDVGAGQPGYNQYPGYGASFIEQASLTNAGAIIIEGGAGSISAHFTLASSGTLTNTGLILGSGTLLNEGLIDSGNRVSGEVIGVTNFVNDGSVTVGAHSTCLISGTVTALGNGAGLFDLQAHAVLTFENPVDAAQTIVFVGQAADLALSDPVNFAGTLDGIQAFDKIDFIGLDVVTATTAGNEIDLGLAGGATFSLALGAPLSGLSLHLKSDGDGGTELLFRSTQAPGHS